MTTQERLANLRSIIPPIWEEYEKDLPLLLRNGGSALNTHDEKTLFYLSMIVAASGLFGRISGTYSQRKTFCNMYLLIQAPPGSGKGLMMGTRVALAKVQNQLLQESAFKITVYKQRLAEALKNRTVLPEKPASKTLFIPANTSSSKLITHLKDNSPYQGAVMIESELDSLTQANKSDFGGFGDCLRKAFQNESIGYTRSMNDSFIEIDEPYLSLCLSGTPNQLHRLIGTAEDGLYSRFLHFSFNGKAEWQDVHCKDCLNFTDLLKSQQDDYYKLWRFYADRDVRFVLTTNQWEQLNSMFRKELDSVAAVGNVHALGVVKRHGLMLFKICAALTAIRTFHLNNEDSLIECIDKDFEIGKQLISISLDSSLEILEKLPVPQPGNKGRDKKVDFEKSMGKRLTRSEAVELGLRYKVSPRTIDRWLSTFVSEGKLKVLEHGHYEKCND